MRRPRSSLALTLSMMAALACAGDDSASSSTSTDGATTSAATDDSASSTTASTASTATTEASTTGESGSVSASSASGDPGGDPSSESSCENFLPPIEPASLAPGKVGEAYAVAFMVPGLDPGYTAWSLDGELPPGLAFDDGVGTLTGTPQSAGDFAFSVTAAPLGDDPGCPTLPASRSYTLVIEP